MTKFIGIDPGFSGAIAVVDEGKLTSVHDMPTMERNVNGKMRKEINAAVLTSLLAGLAPDHVIIERVGPMPSQGVTSVFQFGMGFGVLQGVCAALHIPYELVIPRTWQKEFGLASSKDDNRMLATRLFPGKAEAFKRKMDDGRADATLLAVWGYRKFTGALKPST